MRPLSPTAPLGLCANCLLENLLNRGRATGTYARNAITRDELLTMMAGGRELIDLEQEIVALGAGGRERGAAAAP
ncbi:MAG: hypothetical protein ABI399_12380 [Bauldia sp.]